jgi:hypothetical protein
MKKYFLTIAAIAIFMMIYGTGYTQNSQPHKQGPKDLNGKITGKWKLNDSKSANQGIWEFQVDGNFLSAGNYWGTKKGLYRTDETRSVIVIEIGEQVTEWAASFNNKGILVLKEITSSSEKPTNSLLLTKADPK